jgi:hypothetical protein
MNRIFNREDKSDLKQLSTKQVLKKLSKFPLSMSDLHNAAEVPVMTEDNFINLTNKQLKACLKRGVIVLLQIPGQNVGHFVCMWKQPKENFIRYFDSFGAPIASQPLRQKLGGNAIMSNPVIYQQFGSNTCGPHCALRLAFKDLDDKQYKEEIQRMITQYGITPDILAQSHYVLESD